MGIRSVAWLLGATLLPTPLGAEEPSAPLTELARGDRVRLKVAGSGKTVRGTVEALSAEGIVVRPPRAEEPPFHLSPAQLEKVEVARGRRSRWRQGALIGFIPGALFFGYVGWVLQCDDYGASCNTSTPVATGLVGGAATATVGALIGLAIKTDRWVPVRERRPKVAFGLVGEKGGFRGAVSVAF